MLFSIIVPVYNVEKYLNKCVDSILCQTCADFELILVDDGSSDNSPIICDEYTKKDNRVKVIHKENGGQTSARNAGLEIALGEYVVFIDSDDWVSENYLELFEKAIKEHGVDVVCCGMVKVSEEEQQAVPLNFRYGYYDRKAMENEIFPCLIYSKENKLIPTALWGKVYKKELVVKFINQVDHRIKIGEDAAIVKPAVYNANGVYIYEDCGYYYRTNPNSVTQNKKAYFWDGPKLRGLLLEKQFNLNEFDFRNQIYCSTVHALFSVVVSQFNRKEKYSVIKKDVKAHLNDEYYKNAINKCKTKEKKLRFARFALKHKIFWLIKLYNKIK